MDKDLMSNLRGWRLSLTAFSCVVLMACSSPEEKVQAFTQKGQAYLAEGDWVKARLEFQNALQINPDLVPALFGLAEIAERNSEWQRAFALCSGLALAAPLLALREGYSAAAVGAQ